VCFLSVFCDLKHKRPDISRLVAFLQDNMLAIAIVAQVPWAREHDMPFDTPGKPAQSNSTISPRLSVANTD
jgi:hypothetical protein